MTAFGPASKVYAHISFPARRLMVLTASMAALDTSLRYWIGGQLSKQHAWKVLLSCMVTRAKVSKSRDAIAFSISAIRFGTTSNREGKSWDVCTVVCMPSVLPMDFFSALTTRISARISGQCDDGATSSAILSWPSAAVPARQAT